MKFMMLNIYRVKFFMQNNLETVFEVWNIPCSDQTANSVDGTASGGLSAAYEQAHQAAEEQGIIDL